MELAALIEQGKEQERQEAWDQARETYREALDVAPGSAQLHLLLAIANQHLGRLVEAERDYRTALRLDRGQIAARYNLGMLYRKRGRQDRAEFELEEFLVLARDARDVARGKALLKEMTGQVYEKCPACGRISTIPAAFRWTIRGRICPRCQSRYGRLQSVAQWALLTLFALPAVLLGIWLELPALYGIVNVALATILTMILNVPHELGHALVGRLLGARVLEIRLGMGPVAWEKRLGGTLLSVGRFPLGGYTMSAYPDGPGLRARMAASVSAGVGVNALIFLALIPVTDLGRIASSFAPWEALMLANLFTIVGNLIPFRASLGEMAYGSDGLLLLQLLRRKVTDEELRVSLPVGEAVFALRQKRYAEAVTASEAGLAIQPGNTHLKNLKAIALLEMGQHREARDLLQDLVDHVRDPSPKPELGVKPETAAPFAAILYNNLAYATLLADPQAQDLAAARAHARRAYRALPWLPHVQGTWGSALVETGDIEEGISHLLQAARHHSSRSDRATCLAYAAIGYSRLRNGDQAAAALRKAQTLDASRYVVRKAAAMLGTGTDHPDPALAGMPTTSQREGEIEP